MKKRNTVTNCGIDIFPDTRAQLNWKRLVGNLDHSSVQVSPLFTSNTADVANIAIKQEF